MPYVVSVVNDIFNSNRLILRFILLERAFVFNALFMCISMIIITNGSWTLLMIEFTRDLEKLVTMMNLKFMFMIFLRR